MTEAEVKKTNFIDSEMQARYYRNGGKFTVEDVEYAYDSGVKDGRNERESIIGAMELIKNYCIEITRETGSCRKCVFCSKGYNGCKLQTSPNNWELAD